MTDPIDAFDIDDDDLDAEGDEPGADEWDAEHGIGEFATVTADAWAAEIEEETT